MSVTDSQGNVVNKAAIRMNMVRPVCPSPPCVVVTSHLIHPHLPSSRGGCERLNVQRWDVWCVSLGCWSGRWKHGAMGVRDDCAVSPPWRCDTSCSSAACCMGFVRAVGIGRAGVGPGGSVGADGVGVGRADVATQGHTGGLLVEGDERPSRDS
jgi:hypothetical protein